jgi:bacterial leucyl aminopeptidase
MTAYVRPGTNEEVGVITDFVDPGYARSLLARFALTDGLPAFRVVAFVKSLIDAYLDIPYVETLCKYACSDQYVDLSKSTTQACSLRPSF